MKRISAFFAVVVFFAVLVAGTALAGPGKKCPTCSRTYASDETFCPEDGARLVEDVEKCPECDTVRKGTARYCSSCGYDFTKPKDQVCESCGKANEPNARFCKHCGAVIGRSSQPSTGGALRPSSKSLNQWVKKVVDASSQYSAKMWTKDEIIGPPNVVKPGRDGKAWCPANAEDGPEWILVEFEKAVFPSQIKVHETFGAGCLTKIEGVTDSGDPTVLWQGKDTMSGEKAVLDLKIDVPKSPFSKIKIHIDSAKVKGWNEIDAVELIGYEPEAGPSNPAQNNNPPVTQNPPQNPAQNNNPPPANNNPPQVDEPLDAVGTTLSNGAVAFKDGSSLEAEVIWSNQRLTFVAVVFFISDRSAGLAWRTVEVPYSGFRRIAQTALAKCGQLSTTYEDEEMVTKREATSLWVPRSFYNEVKRNGRSQLKVDGGAALEFRFSKNITVAMPIDGSTYNLPVMVLTVGRGEMWVLDDKDCPLIFKASLPGFTMALKSLSKVDTTYAPDSTAQGNPTQNPPANNNQPPANNNQPAKPVPTYATPEECYQAWKDGIVKNDKEKLLSAYTESERKTLTDSPDDLNYVISRYQGGLKDNKDKFDGKETKKDAVGNEYLEWKWEGKVAELGLFTRKSSQKFRFTKEGGSYRLTIY
jgi:hypothetical protein